MKAVLPLAPSPLVLLAMLVCSGVVTVAEEDALTGAGRSRRLREAIQVGLPKYQPASDDATMTDSGGQAVEKDGVLKLPDVQVRAKKQPRLRERDMRASRAWVEKALQNAPGDKIGNIFGLNNGHAMAILMEELQVKEFNDLKDRGKQISLENSPENMELQRLIKNATTRDNAYWAGQKPP